MCFPSYRHKQQAWAHEPANDALPETLPMISCIMPTKGRPLFVKQALRYFMRQDYPARELVIVYDRESDLPEVPDGQNIRIIKTPEGSSIGAKRNAAVAAAQGAIIAHWDDDDWYGPRRLSVQAAPLLAGHSEISALRDSIIFDLDMWRFWRCDRELHQRMYVGDVHGGTLVYRREAWDHLARYSDTWLREDTDFMTAAMDKGARLAPVPADEHFLYLRHGANSWIFTSGEFIDVNGWVQIDEPPLPAEDRTFYATLCGAAAEPDNNKHVRIREAATGRAPLATCIMPTADRPEFIQRAVALFLQSDYAERELVIIDDGLAPVEALLPDAPCIRYFRLEQSSSLGAKRNRACAEARGNIILHWDDDDWYAPGWIGQQVATICANDVDICGLDTVLFYDPELHRAWRYTYPADQKPWAAGATLCYTKDYWRNKPFAPINVGEDNSFVWSATPDRLAVSNARQMFVATIHAGNTSPKYTADRRWQPIEVEVVENIIRSNATQSMEQICTPRERP